MLTVHVIAERDREWLTRLVLMAAVFASGQPVTRDVFNEAVAEVLGPTPQGGA